MADSRPCDQPLMQFVVIDMGISMTEDQPGRLFRSFAQGDASKARKSGGTGLGLGIGRQLAEMAGDNVAVNDVPDEGSTFKLTIATGPLDGLRMMNRPAPATVVRPDDTTTQKHDAV